MAQVTNIFEEGAERIESTVRSLEKDWKRIQKRAEQRRREFEKQAEKQVKRLRGELRRSPLVKRVERIGGDVRKSDAFKWAESVRRNAQSTLQGQVDGVLAALRIAPQSEVHRLERKVSQLTRKLNELEKKGRRPATHKPASQEAVA
jgi:hypothetical protein